MDEEKFYITERIIQQDQFKGIHGILKHRSTDFVVEEVDPEGRVMEFSSECIYADPDLERKPRNKDEQSSRASASAEDDGVDLESQESRDKVKEELVALFDDADFAESILNLYAQPAASPEIFQVVQDSRVIEDKDHRKRIHMYFKCHFQGKLVTDVVAPMNYFRVSLKKKTGTARPTSYDHRNNQSPDDPKPVPFLEFCLWKDGIDTMESVQILSKRLLMPAKSFSYAGTKDRRSVSVQRIVVRNAFPAKIAGVNKMIGMRMKVSHLRAVQGALRFGDLSGNRLRAVQGALRFGDLSGNRFTIILRNCQYSADLDADFISKTLNEKGFINYYGLQRFGRGGGEVSTDAIGRALLSGNFKAACSMILDPRPDESNKSIAAARALWKEMSDPVKALEVFPFRCTAERAILYHFAKPGHETDYQGAIGSINRELRLMYVHAVQSLWWNAGASKRQQLYGNDSCVVGDLVMKDGGQIETVTQENISNFSVFDVVIPIIGHSTALYPQNDLGTYLRALPDSQEVALEKDKYKQLWDLPGGFRHFLQKPKDFSMNFFSYADADEVLPPATEVVGQLKAVQLRFTLPTSAYATMLLREIFPKDSSTSGDYHKSIETS